MGIESDVLTIFSDRYYENPNTTWTWGTDFVPNTQRDCIIHVMIRVQVTGEVALWSNTPYIQLHTGSDFTDAELKIHDKHASSMSVAIDPLATATLTSDTTVTLKAYVPAGYHCFLYNAGIDAALGIDQQDPIATATDPDALDGGLIGGTLGLVGGLLTGTDPTEAVGDTVSGVAPNPVYTIERYDRHDIVVDDVNGIKYTEVINGRTAPVSTAHRHKDVFDPIEIFK